MIDTHAHLDSDQSIKNSFSTGVEKIIDVSRDSTWADKYENVFLTVGYHPYETDEFDLDEFNAGSYTESVARKNLAEQITMVLYPNDSSENGKELRLRQQYFLSSF